LQLRVAQAFRYALSEIERERRAGYAYYGTWPANLIETDYPRWRSTLRRQFERAETRHGGHEAHEDHKEHKALRGLRDLCGLRAAAVGAFSRSQARAKVAAPVA
jgi:hypothetical protein